MFNHTTTIGSKQAVLVHIFFSQNKNVADLQEFKSLVSSAGVSVVHTISGSRKVPHPKYFVGEGKAEEIAEVVKLSSASIVIFNHILSPSQERNLEHLCNCQIIDRTELILNIFAQRANTHVSKLQVKLAQLRHSATRLVRSWSHLERQQGGIGLRGPGETQLETDRQLLRDNISKILSSLKKIEKQREHSLNSRIRANIPTISLVGYTNAGKSTLFNRMTRAGVYVADKLFATLDPMIRYINIKNVGNVVLSDTVGFIRDLPNDLIASFKATLQETRQATLLLHIVDVTDQRISENINTVDKILTEIKANNIPILLIMNKIDLLNNITPHIDHDEKDRPVRIWLSAHSGVGIELLMQTLTKSLAHEIVYHEFRLPPNASKLRSRFYQLQVIENEWFEEDGSIRVVIKLPVVDWHKLCKQEVLLLKYLI